MDIYAELAREALWLILYLSIAPLMASLIVGLVVSLLQALTQVQEQTLTFEPKVIATIFVLALTSVFMLNTLIQFTNRVFDMMLRVGSGR